MNKKILFLTISLLFFSIVSMAQQLDWAQQYVGDYNEYVNDIKIDYQGNQYRVGGFAGSVDFDPSINNYYLTVPYDFPIHNDGFIQKFDALGNFIWAKQFKNVPSTKSNYVYSIGFDALNNIYLMGCSDGTVDFDPDTSVYYLNNTADGQWTPNYILKLDSDGDFIWVKKIGFNNISGQAAFRSFTVDKLGNVYTTGDFQGMNVDLDPGPGTNSVSAMYGTNRDGFVQKLDSSGNFVWAKQIISPWGVTSGLNSYSISVDNLGNTYTTGTFRGDFYVGPGAGVQNLSSNLYKNIFVLKLDASGNSIWVKQLNVEGDGFKTILDSEDNLLIAGGFYGTADFDQGISSNYLTSTKNNSTFILKLDSLGGYLWAKRTGGQAEDPWASREGLIVELDKSDNIYIAARFSSIEDFDPSLGIYNLTPNLNPSYLFDNYIQKLDRSGNFIWAKEFAAYTTNLYSLAIDTSDKLYISGTFHSVVDVDPDISNYFLINTTSPSFQWDDAYVVKLNQDSCAYNIALIIDSVQNITCSGNSGFVSAYALGGSAPYSYSWNTIPATNDSFAVLDTSRIYEVTVNDANGCAKSSAVIINGPTDQNNFDLNANLIATSFRPGFSANLWLDAFNTGCLPVSGQVKLILSYLVNYDSASIAPDTIQGDTLTWNFSNLIYDSIHFLPQVFLTTDTSATIGNQACFDVIINPIMGDFDSTNNIKNFCFDIINGYDPNDKKVYPKGECNEKYVLNNQKLTYTVRFQNTGNAEAINVYVIDSLDANLDINSVRITSKSHDKLITEVVERNILKFRFDNILLPDSLSNEPMSHGFVVFEVQPLLGLPNGTEIKNSVGIYFDYNPVVVTNSTISTLVDTLNFSTYGSINDTICGGSYIAPSGQIYYSSGNYIDKIPNSANCDSLIFLNITIHNTIKNISVTECENYTSPSGNYIWTKSGIYYDTIPSTMVCDSVYIINLSITKKPEFKQINKIVASDRTFGAFGNAVSTSGKYSIIGSIYNRQDLNGGNIIYNAGAAYIFESDTSNNWINKQKIIASDRSNDKQFGYSVSISGNYAVVGTQNSAGAYIFEREINGVWVEKQKLIKYDGLGADLFGESVSISGDYVVVGARANGTDSIGNHINYAGSAYIFKRDSLGSWNNIQKIYAFDRANADFFGTSVSINEDKIVIGSPFNDTDSNGVNIINGAGSAYIYEQSLNGIWVFKQKIIAPDRAPGDEFGESISISENTIIVGARNEDEDATGGNTLNNSGSVYIYEHNGSGYWIGKQKIVATNRSNSSYFGSSVSINGNKLVVGASNIEAYVFEKNQNNMWLESQKLISADSSLINSVAISDEYIALGARNDDRDINGGNIISNAGSAYIFDYNYNSTINVAKCGVYTLNAQTYTSNGTYQQIFTNALGCDSIVTINFMNKNSSSITNVESCIGTAYVSPSGNYTWSTSGTYVDTIPNFAGCDSIITINLNFNSSTSSTIAEIGCDYYTSPSGNYVWSTNGTYVDTISNFVGCDSIITINLIINNNTSTGTFDELYKAVASDRSASDNFGHSVSISGNYAVIGAAKDDYNAGSAYVFERDNNGNWFQKQKIVASDRYYDDYFGQSVSISGNYAVIGASNDDYNVGSAYVFERDSNGNWLQKQKIVASDAGSNDKFGYSVSINGDYTIICAIGDGDDVTGGNIMSKAGSAYIFERDISGTWYQKQKIVASDRYYDDYFGYSVSINGNTAVIGASYEDNDIIGGNLLNNAGSAYVFERDMSGIWYQKQKIIASDRTTSDNFGWSVSIWSHYLLVGAIREPYDVNGNNFLTASGSAYLFERDISGNWYQKQKIVASDRSSNSYFGNTVSINGNYALVGAGNKNSSYLYERSGNGYWSQKQKIVSSDAASGDYFGGSVSIGGIDLIVGAPLESQDSLGGNTLNQAGSAYLFELNSNSIVNQAACNSYTFNGQTYINSGTYQQILPNTDGCDSVVTLVLTMSSINSSITQNGDTLSSNILGATYQWIDCSTGNSISGAINQTFTATTNGDYAVVLSKNGCVDTSACISIMSVGTYDVVNDFGIEIYPNPTGKKLNVVFNKSEPYQLKIVTIDGKLIETKTIVGNTTLDVSKYSSGMYFITATNNEGKVYQSKFVKE